MFKKIFSFLQRISFGIFLDKFLSNYFVVTFRNTKDRYLYLILIGISILLLFIWDFNLKSIFFLSVFISFALFLWDSTILALGSVVALIVCFLFVFFNQNVRAESVAAYAYYFLLIAVLIQVFIFVKDSGFSKLSPKKKKRARVE